MISAYELSAKVDFKSLEDFIKALRTARTEAGRTSQSVEDVADTLDESSRNAREAESNTRGFSGALRTAAARSELFGSALAAASKPLNLVGFGLAALTQQFLAGSEAARQEAVEIERLAKTAGVSVGALQKLAAAGKKIDIDLQGASDLFRDFGEFIGEFSINAGGPAAEALGILGVSVETTNGAIRESEAVFNDVVDALGDVRNATERSALAVQLFGGDGNKLSTILANGAKEFKNLTKAAEDTNKILSASAVGALADAQEAHESLTKSISTGLSEAWAKVAPATETFYQLLEKLRPTVDFLGGSLSILGRFVITVSSGFIALAVGAQKFVSTIANIAPIKAMIDSLSKLGDVLQYVRNGYVDINSAVELVDPERAALVEPQNGRTGGVIKEARDAAEAQAEFLKAEASAIARIKSLQGEATAAKLAGIDDAILRQKVYMVQLRQANQLEIDNANAAGLNPSTVASLSIAQNEKLVIEKTKLLKLEQAANEELERSNRLRNDTVNSLVRQLELSKLTSTLAVTENEITGNGRGAAIFDDKKGNLESDILTLQIAAEREALEQRLTNIKASYAERNRVIEAFDEAAASKQAELAKKSFDNFQAIGDEHFRQIFALDSLLLQEQNSTFSALAPGGNTRSDQETYQRESLNRQIEQERNALETQLSNYKGFEEKKEAIREEFEKAAANRRESLNNEIIAQNKAQFVSMLAPAETFFSDLINGYAEMKASGEGTWKDIANASVASLQKTLQQMLINALTQKALGIVFTAVGGTAAATGTAGAAATAGAVTSPTTSLSANPIPTSTRRKETTSDTMNVTVSIEGTQNTAEIEAAATRGIEKGLDTRIDKRIAYQQRSGGRLPTKRY